MATSKKTIKATDSKQTAPKAAPAEGRELRADELNDVSGGASTGLPTGQRMHKPY